jgi:hypothetical protein
VTLEQAIASGDITIEGRQEALDEFLGLLDTFPFWSNIVMPRGRAGAGRRARSTENAAAWDALAALFFHRARSAQPDPRPVGATARKKVSGGSVTSDPAADISARSAHRYQIQSPRPAITSSHRLCEMVFCADIITISI